MAINIRIAKILIPAGYTLKTKYRKSGDFHYFFFFLTSGDWKIAKALYFRILNFECRFLFGEISPVKKKLLERRSGVATRRMFFNEFFYVA
jgi:hypothetical protein